MSEAEQLAQAEGDNAAVQICCGTVLARGGKVEEALTLLGKHQGSLDAYVQLLLLLAGAVSNKRDLQCRADCPNPSHAEPSRPSHQGSPERKEMGSGQSSL